ncbi:hypothetical protein E4U42_006520 [Claviceps africana]|uniref:NmrA-like domain-containing protein n=1 Tax=Claviceps africana TaxID=83212 RepID=A0A8K0J889_9HYPO|nr:hypothetical protein E4U42_006520 [Claviceps africana]
MMRIAVAGGGGLGFLLALQLSQAGAAYNVVVLSRSVRLFPPHAKRSGRHVHVTQERPEFGQLEVQLHVVNYNNPESLKFALQGVDLAISTISGREQVSLINAAADARVRVFVPSEFEGSVSKRPLYDDPLDRGSTEALALLKRWERSSGMRYTVFACGVFMERFHPFGLGYLNIGYGSGVSGPGDYLVDINNCTAEYTEENARGHTVRVCLTSVYDAVRFIVAAIDLGPRNWPHEFTMRGDRLSVRDIVRTCSRFKNATFEHHVRQPAELQALCNYCSRVGEDDRRAYYQQLIATTNGRYDFSKASLNEALEKSRHGDVHPMTLARWLANVCQYL